MISLLIYLLPVYGLWLIAQRGMAGNSKGILATDWLFALLYASAHFYFYPSLVIYDDGGIVVRYMDQFAAGHFYCYNPEDGPVFGVSGPLHGLFSGLLAWLHIFSPDHSVLASNFTGMWLSGFFLLRILRALSLTPGIVFPAWALSMLMCRHWLITAKQGLETPLHIAVVLAAILFYLHGRERRFWFFETLMVISKLDALPIAMVLALGFLVQRIPELRPLSWKNSLYRRAILWAVPVGLAWLAFTFLVFDGPLPQTARAKLYHFVGPQDSWFPFLQPFIAGPFGVFAGGLFALFLLHVAVLLLQKRPALIFRDCIFGFATIGHFVLYYFYNPAEQMPWYYTLPDLFLVTQGMVTTFKVVDALAGSWSKPVGALALIGYAAVIWPDMSARIIGHGSHFNVIERERMAVGQWINAEAGPDDKVLCGHGHIARECRRYVIDYSGLNSKKVTELKRDMNALVRHFQPEWMVLHGRLEQNQMTNAGYRIVKSFYNVSSIWATSANRNYRLGETWRVYHRDPASAGLADIAILPDDIETDGECRLHGAVYATGTNVALRINPTSRLSLDFGITHEANPMNLVARMYGVNGVMVSETLLSVPALNRADYVNGYTTGFRLEGPAGTEIDRVEITHTGETSGRFTLMSPILVGQSPK